MSKLQKQYVVPVIIIVVGIAWLLNVLGVIKGVDWVWTCALAAAGILTIAVGGFDKLTGVVGPFLIIASICSVIRQAGRLSLDIEVPILIIVLGILMLAVHILKLPYPKLLQDDEEKKEE